MKITQRLSPCLGLAMLVAAIGVAQAKAQEVRQEEHVVVDLPPQVVLIENQRARFAARIRICADGIAEGQLILDFPDSGKGGPADLQLTAVHGRIAFGAQVILIVFVVADGDRALHPDDLFVATVQPASGEHFVRIYGYNGAQNYVALQAGGTIDVRQGADCQPVDFGQIPVGFVVRARPQTVHPVQLREPIHFAAKVRVDANNSADGSIVLEFRDGRTLLFDMLFGALTAIEDGGMFVTLIGVDQTAGFLLLATIEPTAGLPNIHLGVVSTDVGTGPAYTFNAAAQVLLFER